MIERVYVASRRLEVVTTDLGADTLGRYDDYAARLSLHESLRGDEKAATLWHELHHAFVFMASLRNDLKGRIEERVVDGISLLSLDTLRRNPRLVQLLTGR